MLIFETAVKGVSAAVLQRFVRRAQKLAKVTGEVDILISTNQRLQTLNRRFRRKNKPTDVLSFPRPTGGDIAISADIARQSAALYGHGTVEELKILVLHGMLHLAGYDHESDNGHMARIESRLRAQLKLPASLIDRSHAPALRKSARPKSTQPKIRLATATKKRTQKSAKATLRKANSAHNMSAHKTLRKTKSARSPQ
ncbi:MAG TPA: rRNA maturation RNase YbeY [Candidatus Angelobacter sp.]|jgi:probable rRNA maturation factor